MTTLHEAVQRLLTQPPCRTEGCPFQALKLLAHEDPVEVITEAIQYTDAQARTIVRVEAHALHRLLDRLVVAEREVESLKTSLLTATGKG